MTILLAPQSEKRWVNLRNNFLMALPKWKDSLIKSVKKMKKKILMVDVEVLALDSAQVAVLLLAVAVQEPVKVIVVVDV